MSRRRYLSTDISTDGRVMALAERCGALGALLYTWMIPHADDDRTLTADAYEIGLKVIPGLGATRADVQQALDVMIELGLLRRCSDNEHRLEFPESFWRYQSYIGPARRTPQNAAERREAAQSADDQRDLPQKCASFSSSSSFSSSFPVKLSDETTAAAVVGPSKPGTNERLARTLDALAAAGVSYTPTARDGKALKDAPGISPERLAAAFVAVAQGRYGDEYMLRHLSLHAAVDWVAGFEAAQLLPAKAARVSPANGPPRANGPPVDESVVEQFRQFEQRALQKQRDRAAARQGGIPDAAPGGTSP